MTVLAISSSLKSVVRQGGVLARRYQRVASAPYLSITSNGSTVLPRDLLILTPFLSSINSFTIIFKNAGFPKIADEIL